MLSRRTLLAASTALTLAPGCRAFAAPSTPSDNHPVLITVFLRGGMDSLGIVAPVDDPDYVACRPPELRLLGDGDKAALRLDGGPAKLDFRLHPEMGALHELYADKRVALVHACGLANGTRSHFGAQELIERGIGNPDEAGRVNGGWMARWLAATGANDTPAFSAIAGVPDALALHADTICAADLKGGMNLPGGKQAGAVLEHLLQGDLLKGEKGLYAGAAQRTLDGIALIDKRLRLPDGKVAAYEPGGGASYEDNEIGRSLQSIARVIRLDLGIRAFAADMGGWDTHENQPPRLANLARQLSHAMGAFHTDLHDRLDRVVLVVMSEFSRRLRSNKSNGTDHGHAGVAIVSAPGIAGGKIHGKWPGLASAQLDNAVDLALTTDIRSVLAELMAGPLGTPQATASVFPKAKLEKVGIV